MAQHSDPDAVAKKRTGPKVGDIVWIACRATEGCEGNSAKISLNQRTENGRLIRYTCQTCNKPFHITQ